MWTKFHRDYKVNPALLTDTDLNVEKYLSDMTVIAAHQDKPGARLVNTPKVMQTECDPMMCGESCGFLHYQVEATFDLPAGGNQEE